MTREEDKNKHQLPGQLDKALAALSRYYAREGEVLLQKLVVNSRYWVQEESDYDSWDGGQWGHALHLHVPASIYDQIIPDGVATGQKLSQDLNRVVNAPQEYVAEVFLDLQDDPAQVNWREDSGLLLREGPLAQPSSSEELEEIWEDPELLRVFLSHKADHKQAASDLRQALRGYGVSGFLAHEDIEPTKEWQTEIEKALFSMEALVALLTRGFSDSRWTDQEVGVAIGRGVPVVAVRLGHDPYGFIGKYQALSGKGKRPSELAQELFEVLFSDNRLRPRCKEGLVNAFEDADTFDQANRLMRYLKQFKTATPDLIDRLERARESNSQVRGAYDVRDYLTLLLERLKASSKE